MKIKKLTTIFFLILCLVPNFYFLNIQGKINSLNDINKEMYNGQHLKKDSVNNQYYFSTQADNPIYGDFKPYYKNGHSFQYKINNEIHKETVNFITLNKDINQIKANNIIFCIEPQEIAQWIDNTNENESNYYNLTGDQQKEINKTIATGLNKYSQTGNFDYLAVTQIMVWEIVEIDLIKIPISIQTEYNDLKFNVENYETLPSFMQDQESKNFSLKFNQNTQQYEITLTDKNNVLDQRYKSQLVGNYNNYIVQDNGKNSLKIINNKYTNIASNKITATYNPIPNSGEKNGIKYTNKPIFINSMQDLVSGVSFSNEMSLQVKIEKIQGKIHLKKVGIIANNTNELHPLSGVEFEIYQDLNQNKVIDLEDLKIQTLKTNDKGEITSNYLEYGHYIIKESKALTGYLNNGYQESFVIQNNEEIIELYSGMDLINDIKKGQVDLYKVGDTNQDLKQCKSLKPECQKDLNYLQGVEFEIYQDLNQNKIIDENDLLIEKLVTNENGYALSHDLIYGNYIIKESKQLDGYEPNLKFYPFIIETNGEIIHLQNKIPIINYAKTKPIKVKKTDQYNKPIADVIFNIYVDLNQNQKLDNNENNNENIVDQIKTNEFGEAQTAKLTYGSYLLQEIEVKEDYILNSGIIPFEINDANFSQNIEFSIINELKESNLKIIKKNNYNQKLGGAEFQIYQDLNQNQKLDDNEKEFSKTYQTDLNGEINLKKLAYGTYFIQETKAPKNHQLKSDLITYSIEEDNKNYYLEIYNNKIITQINKLIHTGKEISKFQIILILIILFRIIYLVVKLIKNKKQRNYI